MIRGSLARITRATAGPLCHTSRIIPTFSIRQLHGSGKLYEKNLFGELTENTTQEPVISKKENEPEEFDAASITPENDSDLQEYYLEQVSKQQIRAEKYISPIKKKLFDQVVNVHGFYKNDQIVEDPETKRHFKLHLTPEEIDILEPTIFLNSNRIKSSMKKATVVNRFVRGLEVKTAINQLHFNPKKMATELEKLLKKGLEQANQSGYNTDRLYIARLWTGSDGDWRKRLDMKGRGRTGIIKHPYIHLKAVLKTEQTKNRLAWEKQQSQLNSKPEMFLINDPLNFRVHPYYKW